MCLIIVKFARAVLVILRNKCTDYVRSVGQLNVLAQCVKLRVLAWCVSSECKSVC